jgi:L-asparaginase
MATLRLPTVCLMLGPGTLPSRGKDRMDLARYRKSGLAPLTGRELMEALPEVAAWAEVQVDQASPHGIATLEDLRMLSLCVSDTLARPEVDGVVFVQGTNSIEETAYFLNLTVRSEKPVVVTGAQRPFTSLSSDAPLNLLDAFRACIDPETPGKGVLVVANGELNAARDVAKTHTYRLQTFRSRDLGLLGYADADRIVYYRAPTRRHTTETEFDLAGIPALARVDVIYVSVATQPGLAEAALRLGAQGLVIAASGAGACGNLDSELAAIAADRRAVVVRSTRVGEGRVIRDDNWQWPGMVAADNLSPQKAAVLLALALTRTTEPDEIQRMFEQY